MDTAIQALAYPILAMFLWTFAVMLRNVQVRVQAIMKGELTNEYFECFQGAEPSGLVLRTGNHLRNLFEFPVLFYAALLCAALLDIAGSLFVGLAWSYVALRIAHSLVHLTFNKVPVRFLFFISSNVVLLALWMIVGMSA